MLTFKEFIEEEVTDEEIDSLIESIEWEDIIEMYDEDELVIEGITNIERFKKGQRLKSRKVLMALSRNIKLKRAATPDVIQRRSKTDARKLIMKKLMKGRKKSQLSAAEKNFVEMRTSQMINKNFVARLVPKVKQIDRNRLAGKNK